MKIKLLFVCCFALFIEKTIAQERDYTEISYDLYQSGSASYQISESGTSVNNYDNVPFNHFLYDLSIRFDNYYFRLDASSIAGTLFDALISDSEKNLLQSTHIGVGLLTTNSPLKITENSDLVFGITGFIDSAILKADNIQEEVDFGTFGYSLIADYQLSNEWNAFVEYSRGNRETTEGKNTMRSIRVRASYNLYHDLYITGTFNYKKYSESEASELHEVNATAFSFGILLK